MELVARQHTSFAMKRASTLSLDTRNDLHLTTTGVGYSVKTISEFPSQEFKVLLTDPLPQRLEPPSQGLMVEDVYTSTTSDAYDRKSQDISVLSQCSSRKAPSNSKIHYTMDTLEKLSVKPWRQPLTMAHQLSEMKDRYKGQVDLTSNLIPHPNKLQTAILADHFNNGPTKDLVASTENSKCHGRPFVPQDQAILSRNEPYLTTSNWYHRTFTKKEYSDLSSRNAATFWQCEDYPKAWGYGTARNPLSKSVGIVEGTMRDRAVFKTAATIFRQPKTMHPTHKALQSLYKESYSRHDNAKLKQLFDCPVQPMVQYSGPDTSLLQAVPNMYSTMNTAYGSHTSEPRN